MVSFFRAFDTFATDFSLGLVTGLIVIPYGWSKVSGAVDTWFTAKIAAAQAVTAPVVAAVKAA